MKKVKLQLLLGFLLFTVTANAQVKSPDDIVSFFFEPLKLEKVSGIFNGSYRVLPEENIPYEQIEFFSNEKYPMQYYSNSMSLGNKEQGSFISLFDQKFHLGNPEYPDMDIHLDSTWWRLDINERSYFFSLASGRGGSAYNFIFLLFDITDKKNIKFYCFDTFSFDDVPMIGFIPGENKQLYVLRTEVNGCFNTTPYAITDKGFIPLKNKKGKPYSLKFEWSKWTYDEIKIIRLPENE